MSTEVIKTKIKMHKNNPRVSIIIPCWNTEKFIYESITSALSQNYSNKEVIVIDDGSTDNSLSIIKEFSNQIIIITGSNKGGNHARNKGIRIATGKYLKFLDADDYLLPGCIAAEVQAAESLPEDQLVIGRSFNLKDDIGVISAHAPRDSAVNREESIYSTICDVPITSAPLYPRNAIEKVGGFNESLIVRQDFDLFIRVLLNGYTPKFTNTAIYVYRSHGEIFRVSKQKNIVRAKNEVLLYRSLFEKLSSTHGLHNKQYFAIGLAASTWVTARNNLRNGYVAEAEQLFELAKMFHPKRQIRGSSIYKIMVLTIGPIYSEQLLSKIKYVLGKLPMIKKYFQPWNS